MYLKNSEDERLTLKGQNLARWQDFKVLSGQSASEAKPVMYNGSTPVSLTAGEFIDTIVVDKDGVSKEFTWGASTASKYGLLDEYNKAGDAQASPDTTTGDMPYDDLMADNSAVLANLLQTVGNTPPYDAANVGQSFPWVKVAALSAHTVAQKLSTGFFEAPCGFVLLKGDSVEALPMDRVSVTFKPGDYKGVHAPSMLDGVKGPDMFGRGIPWSKN
jgi:hypothetical protein